MDRYPYFKYTILLGATRALAHLGTYFTHRVFGLSTFTCPYGTFAFRQMPFRLCNALGTFQRCVMAIFSNMVEKTIEVFMDDFSVLGNSFDNFLENLRLVLVGCEETNLC